MTRVFAIGVCVGLLVVSSVVAQTQQDERGRITAVIERWVQAKQRLRLAADRVTLTGDVLHLTGRVRITLGADTLVQAEEATIDQRAGKVELIGNVRAMLGPSALQRPGASIEYR